MPRYQDILAGQIVVRNSLAAIDRVRHSLEELELGPEDVRNRGLLDLLVRRGELSVDQAQQVQKAQALTQFVRAERLYARLALNRQLVAPDLLQNCLAQQREQRYSVRLATLLLADGSITEGDNDALTDEVLIALGQDAARVENGGIQALLAHLETSPKVDSDSWSPRADTETAMPTVKMPDDQPDILSETSVLEDTTPFTKPDQAPSGTGLKAAEAAAQVIPAPVADPTMLNATVEMLGPPSLTKSTAVDQEDPAGESVSKPLAPLSTATDTGSPFTGDDLTGLVVSGRYRILERLGEGAMGAVYKAEHCLMEKQLAFKVLHPTLTRNRESVERFKREVRALSRLQHRNVVQIFDAGEGERGILYMAMELIDGEGLDEILERDGNLQVDRAGRITRQILEAIAEAHALGIIHRDLKPANILVPRGAHGIDMVKIMDFGVAKLLEPTSEDSASSTAANHDAMFHTQDGLITGTLSYMSPEQMSGRKLDHRSDLYATGVVLFEMLTGHLPFESDTEVGFLGKQLLEDVPYFRDVRPDLNLSPELESIVRKLLARDPEDRYQTAIDARSDLESRVMESLYARPGSRPLPVTPADLEETREDPNVLPPRDPLSAVVETNLNPEPAPADTDVIPIPSGATVTQSPSTPLTKATSTTPPPPTDIVEASPELFDLAEQETEELPPPVTKPPRSRTSALLVSLLAAAITIGILVGSITLWRHSNREKKVASTLTLAKQVDINEPSALLIAIDKLDEAAARFPGHEEIKRERARLIQVRDTATEQANSQAESAWRQSTQALNDDDLQAALDGGLAAQSAWTRSLALGDMAKPLESSLKSANDRILDLRRRIRFAERLNTAEAALSRRDVDAAAPPIEEMRGLTPLNEKESGLLDEIEKRHDHERLLLEGERAEKEGDFLAAIDNYDRALKRQPRESTRKRLEKLRVDHQRDMVEQELSAYREELRQVAKGNYDPDADPAEVRSTMAKASDLADQLGDENRYDINRLKTRVNAALNDAAEYRTARSIWKVIEDNPAQDLERYGKAEKDLQVYIKRRPNNPHTPRATKDLLALAALRERRITELKQDAQRTVADRRQRIDQLLRKAAQQESARSVNDALATIRRARGLAANDAELLAQVEREELRVLKVAAIISQIPSEFIRVPAGPFPMGSDRQSVRVDEFYISRYELTQREWEEFVRVQPEARPQGWTSEQAPMATVELPVSNITLVQAQAYCRWRNQSTTRVKFWLPSEAQWEKAAAGPEGRTWPWGNVYDERRVALGQARAVDSTPNGESPFGCADMAGNVAEWTITETREGSMTYALKGGSYFTQSNSDLRCSARKVVKADDRSPDIGFRLVLTFVKSDD